MTAELGLRERKKQRTRETIARVAMELFDRQGYAQTTIAQVAAAADVSPRTVSGYFPAKEELVFPDEKEALALLEAKLRDRGPDQLAPEALRDWVREWMETLKGQEETVRTQSCVIAADESLQAHRQLFIGRIQDLLAAAIAEDMEAADGLDNLEARMAAASTTAIIELIGDHFEYAKGDSHHDQDIDAVEAEVLAMLDRAIVFVTAGIEALGGRAGA
jgi:AcrR family transcriptional regulator